MFGKNTYSRKKIKRGARLLTQHSFCLTLYSKYTTWRSKQEREPEIIWKYKLFKRRSLRKSKHQNQKKTPKYHTTNV